MTKLDVRPQRARRRLVAHWHEKGNKRIRAAQNKAQVDTSLTPHTVSSVPRRPARLLEVEQACSSLAYYLLSSVVMLCPCLFLLAPWSAGGGDRRNVALSYVYANSGCVAASWLCVL